MIATTLPIVETTIDEKEEKLVKVEKSIDVNIDTSIFAEERWEANFPEIAKRETLFAYLERVSNAGLLKDKVYLLSNLKAFYCFLESDKLPCFKSFCQLFDSADGEYVTKLTDKMYFVFNLVLKGSTVSTKN